MTTDNSKTSRQSRLRKLEQGIDKHFQALSTLMLGAKVFTMPELKALIQSDIDASDASVQSRAKLKADVQVERNTHAKVNPVLRLFKAYVISQFGETNDASQTLADFGLTPRKTTKKTVATKVVALKKTEATRAKRHTMGPKQKAKVKGDGPATAPAGSGASQPKST
jgi:hypothetical protein